MKELDMNKVIEAKEYLEERLNFSEICKLFREICYDKVAYWSESNKGVVYDGTYEPLNIEQANRLQQAISRDVDLFEQSVVRKRTFDEGYLREKNL